MGHFNAKPFEAKTAKSSGVSLSVGALKAGQFLRLSLTAEAQQRLFGRAIDPKSDAMLIKLSDEPGKNHLIALQVVPQAEADAMPVSGGPRDSVQLRLAPWSQLAPGKRPPVSLAVVAQAEGIVMLTLPDYLRPKVVKRTPAAVA